METTRHHTVTVYVVHDNATALHEHERLGLSVPPGGHIDRDELPHEAGLREVREETGLDATLLDTTPVVDAPLGRAIPRPHHQMLYDVNVHDGQVGHQHIDAIYYAEVESRRIDPDPNEANASSWDWYTIPELNSKEIDSDVQRFGTEAIRIANGEIPEQ